MLSNIYQFRLDQNPPSPFLPPLNTHGLSPFSLITQQVEMTYQNSKSFLKRNRSIIIDEYNKDEYNKDEYNKDEYKVI